jgi:hypothetical protein
MSFLAVATGETGVVGDDVTTGGTGASVQSVVALDGTYSYKNAQTTTQTSTHVIQGYPANGVQTNTGFSVATAYHNMDFRVDTLPASGDEPILRARAGTTTKLTLTIDSTGKLSVYNNAGTLQATGTTVLSTGTTYNIGLKAGNGTVAYEVQINGASELSGTCAQGATNVQNFIAGKSANFNGNTIVYYHDNHITNDTQFYPTAKIASFVPNANGATMQWTGGTGASDYTQVNPIPRTNTTYVACPAVANKVALFAHDTMASKSLSGATILAVVPVAYVRDNTGTDATNTKMRLVSGATTTDTSGADTGTGMTGLGQIFDTDPNTGAAWTETNFNNTQWGATDTSGFIIRMTGAFMYVVYTPAVAATAAPQMLMMGVG